MSTADQLVELMLSWIRQREQCAEKLKKLAEELESLREKCNASECVGSSVAVLGAATLIGAGVATLVTGGAAAPLLVSAAACTGVGVAVSVGTKITEHFISSDTMKEAQKIEKKSKEIADKIQKLFQQLKEEVKKLNPSADLDKVDRLIVSQFVRAFTRRNSREWQINLKKLDKELQCFLDVRDMRLIQSFQPELMDGLTAILTFFTFSVCGKKSKVLFAKGAELLTKEMSKVGLKTALKGGAMVVGGAVGLAFELPEMIDNWKDLIKNNHVTEASQSLRDTANDILKMTRLLREQLNNIKKTLEEMAKRQREQEERKRQTQQIVLCSLLVLLFGLVLWYQNNKSSIPALKVRKQQVSEAPTDPVKSEEVVKTGPEQEIKTKTYCRNNKESNEKLKINQRPPAAINVALLNVRSMEKNTSRILELIKQNNLHVLLSTETWLRSDNADRVLNEASPQHYSYCYQVRTEQRGGGVATQFLEALQGENIILDDTTSFEYVATALTHEEWAEPLLIINVYRPPESNIDAFLEQFQRLLDDSLEHYSSVIIAGDFNIWVDTNNPNARRFLAVLEKYKLVQHVKEPTRYDNNKKANHTLDLVITTRNVEISDLFVRDDNISDHHTVYFNVKPVSKEQKEKLNEDETAKRFKRNEE